MSADIVVAGATGNLGRRIVAALAQRGAGVRALVRPGSDAEKTAGLSASGVEVISADYDDAAALRDACAGAGCVVSALQGLRDVIVDTQLKLLEAAVAAGVPRFIPSDFAADFTKVGDSENRNFAWRRAFRKSLLAAPIRSTSILNGMFMDLLAWGVPVFDMRKRSVSYAGSPDQKLDFTTMDDTAAFTALAAMDADTPAILRIAGDQLSASDLAALGREVTGVEFSLVRLGSLDDLAAGIAREREAHPEQEEQEFPRFQQMQYMHNMQSGRAKLAPLDNDRYPELRWTTLAQLLRQSVGAAAAR